MTLLLDLGTGLAVLGRATLGQGPLERGIAAGVRGTRRLVLGMPSRTAASTPG